MRKIIDFPDSFDKATEEKIVRLLREAQSEETFFKNYSKNLIKQSSPIGGAFLFCFVISDETYLALAFINKHFSNFSLINKDHLQLLGDVLSGDIWEDLRI